MDGTRSGRSSTRRWDRVSISSGSDRAVVAALGAHVEELSLGGNPIIKTSTDGSQTHGGIAVLVPFAGRVRGGRYEFGGKKFALPVRKDGNAIHGFAKDARWSMEGHGRGSVELESRLGGRGYPGAIVAKLRYTVGDSTFATECSVRNVGTAPCPLVVGFHPYFLADDWEISSGPKAYRYQLEDRYFPTGEKAPYSFDGAGPDTPLDDCFRVDGLLQVKTEAHTLVIRRKAMSYLVVYDGEYAEKKSVAIEPYTGLPDAYNNGIGLRSLKPQETFRCGYEVVVESHR